MIWFLFAAVPFVFSVILWIVARAAFQFGQRTAFAQRKPLLRASEAEEVPELFTPEEVRRRRALSQRHKQRAGNVPWNYRRPGMGEAEREALQYQLETGKLDEAVDRIVAEERDPKK